MDRRAFLAGAALASVAGRGLAAAEVDDLRTAAREAWLYSLPLVEIGRLRAAIGAAGINAFASIPSSPSGPGEISAPEPDVLYASAWIDVSGGSATLRIPPTSGRYFTVTVMDMYSNVLEVLGSGAAGQDGGAFTLQGPPPRMGVAGYTVPEPRMPTLHRVMKSRAPWVWALARIQASGEGGLAAAQALRDSLEVQVKAPAGRAPTASAGPDAGWSDYFYAAQKLIDENPPPPYETDFFRRIAPLQLGMAGGFERARFADADLDQIAAGVADAQILAANLHPTDGVEAGWLWPSAEPGGYGQDFLARARTAINCLGAPAAEHLLTLRAAAPDGSLAFHSDAHYRLALPTPPPVDGFWTLALYEIAADGRLFPTANALGRHALGSHSDLRSTSTGEIDIWIGQADPGGAHTPNWLPAPAQGSFALVLRAYLPAAQLLSRAWRPPAVELLGPAQPPPQAPPSRRRR
jgi:hypothetical protein